jgi:tungstate transport system permease protein
VSVSDLWAIFDTQGLWRIILLSLRVSLSATALAALFGAPLGAALAACPFPGRRILVVAANAFLGLPPMVVGLALYLLLSRSGPLGALGLLFTPSAMVLAQTELALPIVTALVHAASADLWAEYGAALQVDGASSLRAVPHPLAMARLQLVLAGFGRTISEVGAILIVGGNIAGYTRTMAPSHSLPRKRGRVRVGAPARQSVARSWPRPRPDRDQHRRQCDDLCLRCQGRTMVVRGKLAGAILIGSALFAGEASRAEEAIVLASTTSVENSGLLARILPEFTRATGISVRVLAQGTGQALATAADGDADLVLVQDPQAQDEFVAQGHGIDRRQIAWNDFMWSVRSRIRRILPAAMTRSPHSRRSPPPAPHLSRAATRAAPTPSNTACGARPGSTPRAPAAGRGTATSAAAWVRHSTPHRRWAPTRSPTAAPGSALATRAGSPCWSKAIRAC